MNETSSNNISEYLVVGALIVSSGQVFDVMDVRILNTKAETLSKRDLKALE